jgi:flagellar protein FliO/FliZ
MDRVMRVSKSASALTLVAAFALGLSASTWVTVAAADPAVAPAVLPGAVSAAAPSVAPPPVVEPAHEGAESAKPATPLSVRPATPVQLAPDAPASGFGFKLFFGAAIIGGLAWYLRKRGVGLGPGLAGAVRRPTVEAPKVLARTRIGLRQELVVVEVSGQRFLLGVTPHSIQSVAVLNDPEEEEAAADTAARSSAPDPTVHDRFEALLSRTREPVDARRPSASTRAIRAAVDVDDEESDEPRRPSREPTEEGQARALRDWMGRP